MDKVKINRKQLLDIVKENRRTHVEDYQEALMGFQKVYCDKLQKALEKAQTENPEDIEGYVSETPPQSREKGYNTLIRKLEISVDENIELSDTEFNCYVMDEWGWKTEFSNSVNKYKR